MIWQSPWVDYLRNRAIYLKINLLIFCLLALSNLKYRVKKL